MWGVEEDHYNRGGEEHNRRWGTEEEHNRGGGEQSRNITEKVWNRGGTL